MTIRNKLSSNGAKLYNQRHAMYVIIGEKYVINEKPDLFDKTFLTLAYKDIRCQY